MIEMAAEGSANTLETGGPEVNYKARRGQAKTIKADIEG
jgi:hypothetical protein